ncbi:O-antigen ligase family protein [Acinetobacter sp. CAAS 2-6]|uniref:O-antigen ligase family protein n=1 Tax=Acinetobacter sp. CAAS 2-6 TaxID=3016358 RepID=UPI002DD62873|nr:O-antigen ligase family protein [Acinetobacter sp. CAAS 2-6]
MFKLIKHLQNKELFIALYFLLFILGASVYISSNFYNEARVLEVLLLVGFGFYAVNQKKCFFNKKEYLFLAFIYFYFLIFKNDQLIFFDIILFYLLYKSFFFLNYHSIISKMIVLSSFLIFSMFPFSLFEYLNTGAYKNWYPLPWNIRIYNSYFLIISIFATWFFLREHKHKNIYLAFIFLAFLSILLDGGRSATLAYTFFILIVSIFNQLTRFKLLFTYILTWLTYFSIIHFSNYSSSGLIMIARETTSGRSELWKNAFKCWINNPFFGCGFYQLDKYSNLPAHPHNLFIQILTETGLLGFSCLAYVIFYIGRNISWNLKENYFVLAAFLAIGIDLSFSGVHIYPITQVALLWLFIFLLKNPEFQHATYFNKTINKILLHTQFFGFMIYIIITFSFIYLFSNTSVLSKILPSTPPRFWEYAYQLF